MPVKDWIRKPPGTYAEYQTFLKKALTHGYKFLPLKAWSRHSGTDRTIGLRHDVDLDHHSALKLARLEHEAGISATYFVLHTAPYYGYTDVKTFRRDRSLLGFLQVLQKLGHEVAFHYDLLTLELIFSIDPVSFLGNELEWMRSHGIQISGVCGHGSRHSSILGYNNRYFFRDVRRSLFADDEIPDEIVVNGGAIRYATADLQSFDLRYDADLLQRDHYFSDTYRRAGSSSLKWHVNAFDYDLAEPGQTTIINTHPWQVKRSRFHQFCWYCWNNRAMRKLRGQSTGAL